VKKRRWTYPQCKGGVRDESWIQKLRVGGSKTLYDTVRQILGLEVATRVVELSVGMREIRDGICWKARPPSDMKENVTSSIIAGEGVGVVALVIPGNFAPTEIGI
jgi:hypothetical protein